MIRIPKTIKKIVLTALPLSFLLVSSNLPVVNAESSEVEVSFIADEGGMLVDTDGKTQKTIVKTVKDGTDVTEVFPNTKPDDNYKFDMWAYPEENKDSGKITSVVREYRATFFPDFNNNGKDDRTEEIVIKFETNTTTKIDDKKIKVGETIEIPKLLKENNVFLGWFYDSNFTKPVDVTEKMLESKTLYAKWSTTDDLTNSTSTVTIRDKEVSDQLEKHLFDKHLKLDKELDEKALKDEAEIKKVKEETTMTVVHKKMDNRNVGRNYLMKFYDTKENFLFSLVLPYGKTVRTVNETKDKISEYSVRQTTTIVLDEKEYINTGSDLDIYQVRNVQENSTEIAEVYPLVKPKAEPVGKVQQPSEVVEQKKKKKINFNLSSDTSFYLIGGGIMLLVVSLMYVWKFKIKKNKPSETEEIKEDDVE